ncbi:MAG: histidinol-phosphate transaminase [Verrucomicrobia bacterium]|nr:histidinol-phosphate transaminase [Verrucomicrobiota bacterium]
MTPQPNPYVADLEPYEPGRPIADVAKEHGLLPNQIAKLASNENPLGASPRALQAIRDGLAHTHLYPDGAGLDLRDAIAKKHGLTRDHVVLGCGSNEIIEFCYHAYTQPGQGRVLASAYAFAVYGLMARLFGISFEEVPDRDFHHDLAGFSARLGGDVRLVFLASPNNPTGTRIPNAELTAFVQKFPAGPLLVLDEAYHEFIPEPPPSVHWVKEGRPVVVLRTFSKVQGLAGLRIGYGLARPDIAAVLQKSRQPFNTSAPAQAAALAALADTDHVRKTVELTHAGLERIHAFLKKMNLRFVPGTANFVMVEVNDGDQVFRALQKLGLIVRPLRSYRLPGWIRISIGTPEQMERLERALPDVLPARK